VSNPFGAIVGFLYAALLVCFAFGLAGAGHGRLSSLYVSLAGLLFIPFAAVARAQRRRSLLIAAVVVAALSDVSLFLATLHEGFDYMGLTFSAVPILATAWAGFWLLWQIAVIIPLLRGTRHT
jgi:hypothetical protein